MIQNIAFLREGNGREGKGKERNGREGSILQDPSQDSGW